VSIHQESVQRDSQKLEEIATEVGEGVTGMSIDQFLNARKLRE